MEYFNGDFFCHTPIVDPEKYYDCRHIIKIGLFPKNCPLEKISRAARTGTEEWNTCIKRIKISTIIEGTPMTERTSTLNQEIIDWLNENITDSTDKQRSDMPQGWMIYDPMLVYETIEVSVFFLRKTDAMAFKLRWS